MVVWNTVYARQHGRVELHNLQCVCFLQVGGVLLSFKIYFGGQRDKCITLFLRVFVYETLGGVRSSPLPITHPLPDGAVSTRLVLRSLNTYQHFRIKKESIGRDIGVHSNMAIKGPCLQFGFVARSSRFAPGRFSGASHEMALKRLGSTNFSVGPQNKSQ